MTVLVTGASGHVGANLVRELIKEKRTVRALIRDDSRGVEGLDIETVKGNILDYKSLFHAVKGNEVVFHLAASISIVGDKSGQVRLTNVEGTRNVVQACLEAGVCRLVHFSSIHAYSPFPLDQSVDENSSAADARSPAYDRTKAEGNKIVFEGVKKGLDAVIVAPTGIIGPNDFKLSRMGAVLVKIYNRKLFGLIDGGYNWVDVRDVVHGALLAEKKALSGSQYILSGEWVSIPKLAQLIQESFGVPAPRFVSPMWLARLAAPFSEYYSILRKKEPHFTPEALVTLRSHKLICRKKAEEELGYRPRPLKESIEDTLRWYEKMGMLQ
jgi:dihydroflavonol-4-reductase